MGDPVLRQQSSLVEPQELHSTEVMKAIEDMQTALDGIQAISANNGTAISAPQVGVNKRIVTLRLDDAFLVLINPRIAEASETLFDFVEECFSLYYLRGVVQRHQTVSVVFEDVDGHQQERTFTGEASGIVQHEIDHLDGVLFIDRVTDPTQISTIDYFYKDRPQRLQQVKNMYAYMSGLEA